MFNSILLTVGKWLVPVPEFIWRRRLAGRAGGDPLAFMTRAHHDVRNYVVRELPRAGHPLMPEDIARALREPYERVLLIVDELQQHMTFLFTNEDGAVTWAYPVTVEETPHKLTFSSGEEAYAA